jgi:hypothetical protein
MTLSFAISKLARLGDRQATAISLELGIHNAALAIAVGASLAPDVTIPAAVYASFMLFTGGGFAWVMSKRNRGPADDIKGGRRPSSRGRLFDSEQIDDGHQGFVRSDRRRDAGLAVGKVCRREQLATAAFPHSFDSLFPAGGHAAPAPAEFEAERFGAPRGVDLFAVLLQYDDIVDRDDVTLLGFGPGSSHKILHFQLRRRWSLRGLDLWLGLPHFRCGSSSTVLGAVRAVLRAVRAGREAVRSGCPGR